MAKIRKNTIQESANLRIRTTPKGNRVIYLDYIDARGQRVRESLHLKLLPEGAVGADVENANMMRMAEAIKARRLTEVAEGRQHIRSRRDDMPLEAFLDEWVLAHENKNSRHCTICVTQWVLDYAGKKATLGMIDRDFCAGFSAYLQDREGAKGKKLSPNTARMYWNYFCASLSWAFRRGWITEIPSKRLEEYERPRTKDTHRVFLTIEELKRLCATNPTEHCCRAYLFSCFCGLRLGDVKALRWRDIQEEDGRLVLKIVMQKTKRENIVPLSEGAVRWLPSRDESPDGERVFDLPVDSAVVQYYVRKMVKKAGITKHITFHTSRHTFATSLFTKGADIYTTSKLLGHTSIKTTQIYANIVDKKKRDAVDLLDGI